MEQLEESVSQETPVWAIFGDLMAGLVGVFVLILVWTLGIQLELAQSLEIEIQKREAEEQRRMALEDALERLEAISPRQCRVVELRFFGGLSVVETARFLEISASTVKDEWRVAKAWLAREFAQS